MRLWDLTHPDADPVILEGHDGYVNAVAFAPDRRHLASGSMDGTVRLWDLARPDADPAVLEGHQGGVWSVAFAPDGQRLASSGVDRTVRLWTSSADTLAEIVCARVWRNLTLDEWRQFVGDPNLVPYQSTCPNLTLGEGVVITTPSITTPVNPTTSPTPSPFDALKSSPVKPAEALALAGTDTSLAFGTPAPTPRVAIWSQEP